MNWLSGINALVGIWMIVSPWVVGFSHDSPVTASAVISGIIVLVLGAIRFIAGFTMGRRPLVAH
jgi:SPW repeat-containing protein